MMWPSNTIPVGWLQCDGSVFNTTAYPKLAAVLGGNTVPDFRGAFTRGAATGVRLSKIDWTTGLPRVGLKTDNPGNHKHDYTSGYGSHAGISSGSWHGGEIGWQSTLWHTSDAGAHTHTISGGDSETAPDHVLIHYIIKADESYTLTV
jgi:microcystin-dependent protein